MDSRSSLCVSLTSHAGPLTSHRVALATRLVSLVWHGGAMQLSCPSSSGKEIGAPALGILSPSYAWLSLMNRWSWQRGRPWPWLCVCVMPDRWFKTQKTSTHLKSINAHNVLFFLSLMSENIIVNLKGLWCERNRSVRICTLL